MRQAVQFDALLDGEAHRTADLFMSGAEGNALVNQISCRGHGIQIARLRRFAHALAIEFEGGREPRNEIQHLRHKADGKDRLLGLLHVFIVGQRQPFELHRHRLRRAMNAPHLGANQLGQIGILLLRHRARSR